MSPHETATIRRVRRLLFGVFLGSLAALAVGVAVVTDLARTMWRRVP